MVDVDPAAVVAVGVADLLEAAEGLDAAEAHRHQDVPALGLAPLEGRGIVDEGLGVFAPDLPLGRDPGEVDALEDEVAQLLIVHLAGVIGDARLDLLTDDEAEPAALGPVVVVVPELLAAAEPVGLGQPAREIGRIGHDADLALDGDADVPPVGGIEVFEIEGRPDEDRLVGPAGPVPGPEGYQEQAGLDGEGLRRQEARPGLDEAERGHVGDASLQAEAEPLTDPASGQDAGQEVGRVALGVGALGLALDVLERQETAHLDLDRRGGRGRDRRLAPRGKGRGQGQDDAGERDDDGARMFHASSEKSNVSSSRSAPRAPTAFPWVTRRATSAAPFAVPIQMAPAARPSRRTIFL